ncbi:hypothetical protein LWF15_11120 [Kineosporia rhizophila]|uniref:hypothetical protein n=1 Tax=Kineosporia rhizophila TaxID=84633 RepID=UPI001E42C6CC|nr:hypothetical protein [Kineosporia rhizophila]MCE0536061.1 hypothetical protein [Kineosporia rhizophila]
MAIMPVLLVGLAAPALAGTTPGGDESISVIGDPSIGAYDTTITRDGSTGDSAVGKSGGEGTSSQGVDRIGSPAADSEPEIDAIPVDPRLNCTVERANPQPAKSDAVWEGNDDGVIMLQTCRHVDEGFVGLVTTLYWAATEEETPPEAPTVTPEQLAQEALARLQVPKPQFHRSPPETAEWRGTPYTWISIPTWFWVTTSWTPLEETARLGSVWATVSVTPERLLVDGGDGGEPTQCDGPGVPHPESSSTSDQSLAEVDVPADACTYVYSQVAEGVTPEVTIVWSASWQGSGGTGADLPTAMTTAVGDAMAVLQIETVIE